jgi:hypothetical protein
MYYTLLWGEFEQTTSVLEQQYRAKNYFIKSAPGVSIDSCFFPSYIGHEELDDTRGAPVK